MVRPISQPTQHVEYVEYVEYVEEDDGYTQPTNSYNLSSRIPPTTSEQHTGVPDMGGFDPGCDPGFDPGFECW